MAPPRKHILPNSAEISALLAEELTHMDEADAAAKREQEAEKERKALEKAKLEEVERGADTVDMTVDSAGPQNPETEEEARERKARRQGTSGIVSVCVV